MSQEKEVLINETITALSKAVYFEDSEVEDLVDMLEIIHDLGFIELIENLKTNRNKLDFITELIVISQIVRELRNKGISFEVDYEIELEAGSPDLKIVIDNKVYWIQIKRLNDLRIDAINRKVIERISERLKDIKKNLFFDIYHGQSLEISIVESFINWVHEHENEIKDDGIIRYTYGSGEEDFLNEKFIELRFVEPKKTTFAHLTNAGTMGSVRCISKESESQIKRSVEKALSSIDWKHDENTINIIMSDSAKFQPIEIANALFGKEQVTYYQNGELMWSRDSSGLINNTDVTEKLNYYVALIRKSSRVFSEYRKLAFVLSDNENSDFADLFSIDKTYIEKTFID